MRGNFGLAQSFARTGFRLGLVALVVVALGAFGAFRPAAAQDGDAQVRLLHGIPDAGPVDVYVNGEIAVPNFEFATATDFIALPAGDYDVDVVPAGADVSEAVILTSISLDAGIYYDISAVGLLVDESQELVQYEVDAAPVAADSARIRVVHNSPDAGPVDVALADGTLLFEGIEYPFQSDYIEVAAGSYDIQVLAAGTDTVALDLPGVTLEAGIVYDVHAVGLLEDGSLDVVVLTLEAGTSAGADEATDDPAEEDASADDTSAVVSDDAASEEGADAVGGDTTADDAAALPTSGAGVTAVQNSPIAALVLLAAAVAGALALGTAFRAGRATGR